MNTKHEILWGKLPEKEIDCEPYRLRVLRFDPINLPNVFTPKPYSRHQCISVEDIFPKRYDKKCACGCNKRLEGRQIRWATEDCSNYAVAVRFIVAGSTATIARYLRLYYGWKCSKCGCEDKGHDFGMNGIVSWIKIDHIIPVKHGGGACWLSNYQLLCHDCHVGESGVTILVQSRRRP
jgi:5-methylcytosine-specific restriction endonuclease McrA